VAAWLAAGGVVATIVVALASSGAPSHRTAAPAVAAPPVREVELGAAMRNAGCDVRRSSRQATPSAGATVAPGIYRHPVTADERRRVVRAGIVVIEYRGGLDRTTLARLVSVQRAAPNGTVLAPSAVLRDDALSVTTFGRQLRCPSTTARSFDALQLFRGRYVGSGPGG
jgi:hypothetical protein